MKNNLNGMFVAVPLALSVALSACGGGDDDDNSNTTETSSTVSITGVVAKGIVSGASVKAYSVNTDGSTGSEVGSSDTTSTGSYSMTLDDSYTGGPLKVTVAQQTGAQMKCDLAAGCGSGVEFGDQYTIASSFSLSVLSADADDQDTMNVTALTTLASAVVEEALSTSSASDTQSLQNEIAGTNSAIADLFGISTSNGGDLTSVPVIDLTDDAAVTQASASALKYAAMGPAIVSAVQTDATAAGSSVGIEEALASFVSANNDGSILASSDTANAGVTDLKEILEAAEDVLVTVESETTGSISALETVRDSLDSDIEEAEENVGEEVSGDVSDGAYATDQEKAKIAVAQIRELSRGIETEILGEDLVNSATIFGDEIQAVNDVAAAEHVVEAMGLAFEAMLNEVDDEEVEAPVVDDEGTAIVVTFSDTDTYTVTQNIVIITENDDGSTNSKTVAVNVVANSSESFTETETEVGYASTFNGAGDFDLVIATGTATSGSSSLTVNTGTVNASLTVTEDELEIDYTVGDIDGHYYEDLRTNITAQLEVTLRHESTTFVGNFGVSFTNFVSDYNEDIDHDENSGSVGITVDTEVSQSTVTFGVFSFDLAGQFSNGTDSFNASVSLDLDGEGRTFTDSCTKINTDNNGARSETETCVDFLDNETAANMLGASFGISMDTTLEGIADIATITFGVNRTGLEAGEAELVVSYPGVELDFDLAVGDIVADVRVATITITNLDGVVLSMSESCTQSTDVCTTNTGTVTVNGTNYGSITEANDIFTVNYVDGSFETIQ